MLVEDLMDRDLTSLGEDATLMEAIEVLSRHRIPGIPIVNDEGKVIGFLSEKDIVRAALPGYVDLLDDPSYVPDMGQFKVRMRRASKDKVGRHMTKEVICLNASDSDFHAALIMIKKNLKRVPVVEEDGILVGVLNRADIIEHLMSE